MRAISTEKAVKLIEAENTILFSLERRITKPELKEKLEKMFNIKVDRIRTHIRKGEKIAFVKLKKENSALDLATKLGLI